MNKPDLTMSELSILLEGVNFDRPVKEVEEMNKSKEEFANYVIGIMEAWKKGEEIEYRELLSPESIWRNISEIPPNETLWVFEYRHFRVKPKSIPATEEELEYIKGLVFDLLGIYISFKTNSEIEIQVRKNKATNMIDISVGKDCFLKTWYVFDPITKTWQDW